MYLLLVPLLVSGLAAQDSHHCPDGWVLQEDRDACRCFLFSGREMVTRDDADLLCDYHDRSWVAEVDYPGGVYVYRETSMFIMFMSRLELLAEGAVVGQD